MIDYTQQVNGSQLGSHLAEACGECVELVDNSNGWPARLNVKTADGLVPVNAYLRNVTCHTRKEYEARLLPPGNIEGNPIISQGGVINLLAGIAFDDSRSDLICVGFEADRREGATSRSSIIFHRDIVSQAAEQGWAEYPSGSGERVIAFRPPLLPAYLQFRKWQDCLSSDAIITAVRAAGVTIDSDAEASARGREAVTRLVRSARFRADIVMAYGGRCAITGVNWGLVEAAHILPVSVEGSTDNVANGIALSPSCHVLFDRHRIYISPDDYRLSLHPELYEDKASAASAFIASLQPILTVPQAEASRPSARMLEKRYSYFGDAYGWID